MAASSPAPAPDAKMDTAAPSRPPSSPLLHATDEFPDVFPDVLSTSRQRSCVDCGLKVLWTCRDCNEPVCGLTTGCHDTEEARIYFRGYRCAQCNYNLDAGGPGGFDINCHVVAPPMTVDRPPDAKEPAEPADPLAKLVQLHKEFIAARAKAIDEVRLEQLIQGDTAELRECCGTIVKALYETAEVIDHLNFRLKQKQK